MFAFYHRHRHHQHEQSITQSGFFRLHGFLTRPSVSWWTYISSSGREVLVCELETLSLVHL